MCLILYRSKSNRPIKSRPNSPFVKRMNASKDGKITCWKIYYTRTDGLVSVHQAQVIEKPGDVISDRESKSISPGMKSLYKGIHVYVSKREVKRNTHYYNSSWAIIVPVLCDKKDFVAEGIKNEALFMKVEITKRNWNRIMKGHK